MGILTIVVLGLVVLGVIIGFAVTVTPSTTIHLVVL